MKQRLIIAAMLAGIMLTGCTSVYNLTSEESDLIAEYSANVLINNAFTNKKEYFALMRYLARQEEDKETQASAPVNADVNNSESIDVIETDASGEATGNQSGKSSNMKEILGLGNIEITCLGYEITDIYPKNEYALSTTATNAHKLLVVHYEFTNPSSESVIMNIDDGISIKAVINNSTTVKSYATLLNEDIMNMDGKEIASGETIQGVFIFNVKDELCSNITSLNVTAKK